jgi:hypothetical protein
MDYSLPLDAPALVIEVASSAFAFKAKVTAAAIKLLWQ